MNQRFLFAAAAGVLGRFLGVADGLLALAFDFLNHAFALQLVGTDGLADTLLGLADGLIGGAFCLPCYPWNSPSMLLSFTQTSPKCSESS